MSMVAKSFSVKYPATMAGTLGGESPCAKAMTTQTVSASPDQQDHQFPGFRQHTLHGQTTSWKTTTSRVVD
jgi:hypothetical protein